MEKVIVVVSDCHLAAGRYFGGRLNPHEDFLFDDEMCDLLEHFSTGRYGAPPDGPAEVELVLAGDFLDFLNVAVNGEFEDAVTEETSLRKLRAILDGHPKVFAAFREFAALPGKSITYLVGNHDADLLFPKIRETITRAWDPEGSFPSARVKVVADTDRLRYDGGVEIHHGNQQEFGSDLDFDEPYVENIRGEKLLKMPYSSIYVLKIVNRMKWEREYFDKIRPVKVFVLFGLILDPWFTIRFVALTLFYFFKTRIHYSPHARKRRGVGAFFKSLKQESKIFQDLEREARAVLDRSPDVKTVLFGHTHRPMHKIYPDGKQYLNTGTWTKMIDLDWRGLGQQLRRTFALIHIRDGQARCELRQWVGEHSPHKVFDG